MVGGLMRARNLKPGFFKNEDLGQLPYADRLLFAGRDKKIRFLRSVNLEGGGNYEKENI
jgi:hypothetical protein